MTTPQANYSDIAPWLRLLLSPGIGPQTARKLLMAFGSAEAIFHQSYLSLTQVVSQNQASAILATPEAFEASSQQLQKWLNASQNHHVITLDSSLYPPQLFETADPPMLLYAIGRTALLKRPSIAIVGSRRPTPQGKETAKDFARFLSQQNITIISGLALGIDGTAQEAALEFSGSTVAVLGTGIDRVYPASHHQLAHQIAQHGLLLSEFPLGTPPSTHNFPKRNRIIAGLSVGTLVVEATLRSGSLITAKTASEIGREVFAIPGSIHNPQSKGCHWLIKQGAKLTEQAQDIMEELQLWQSPSSTQHSSKKSQTSSDRAEENHATEQKTETAADRETLILNAIGTGPTSFEAILSRTALDTATLQSELFLLELNQKVATLPGNLYQTLHQSKA